MAIEMDSETYYNATEAAKYLKISKDTFYRSVKKRLQPYKLGYQQRAHYRKSEIDALQRSVVPFEPENDKSE